MTTHAIYAARGINPVRLNAILQHGGSSILDVGCGNGAYVLALADRFDIKGIDHQEFEAWRTRPDLFSVSDANNLPTPDNAVDTVVSFECLEHLPEPSKVLREYHRITRRNIIITVPNCQLTAGMTDSRIAFYHYTDRSHVNFFTLPALTSLVIEAGFSITHARLINPIQWSSTFREVLRLPRAWPNSLNRLLAHAFNNVFSTRHCMTCLVVANKASR